jgi:hypothetical protein
MCLQALQGFDERDLPFLPRSPHVGNTSKHLDIAVAINDFPLHLMPCEALQAVKQLLGCTPIMLVKPRDGRFAAQGSMPSHSVSIMDVAWQISAKRFKNPLIVLPVKVLHVVSEGAFQFAVGLGVKDRGVDQADPRVLAKRHQEPSLKGCAVVKEHGLGDHPPLPHGGDEGRTGVRMSGSRNRSQKT